MSSIIHWRKSLVSSTASLEEAIQIIDQSALRIGLIIDATGKLLGTLTDGDVRRALIRHQSLATPVIEVMCRTPQTGLPEWDRARLLAVMEEKQIIQLPIVTVTGELVGLQTLHGLLHKPSLPNAVFIMAGGFGKRLYPLTEHCPKPMLKVGNKPILELILQRFIDAGFARFFISTHYLPEVVRDYFGDGSRWGCTICYTHEDTPLGTGGALGLLPHDEINEPLLMTNGDLLTTLNYAELLQFHNQQGKAATMCVREYEYQVPYGVVQSNGSTVTAMVEKPTQKFFVNAGIYVLNPEVVQSVSAGHNIDMPTLLEQHMHQGRVVAAFPVYEYWLDIGRMDDFNRAQLEVARIMKP